MAPSGCLALRDFARFAGEEGCSLYFERLVHHGFDAWPRSLRRHYPGFRHWRGAAELKRSLCRLAGFGPETEVLIAGRSAFLMEAAARALFRRCDRVLVTDLAWPGYRKILDRVAARIGGEVGTLPIRRAILGNRLSGADLVRRITDFWFAEKCDGLFLPAVSHDGIRLPLPEIGRAIGELRRPRFAAVVDAAQAFCHAPLDRLGFDGETHLAGCHKWLGARLPLGVAVLPRYGPKSLDGYAMRDFGDYDRIDDPLLCFLDQAERRSLESFSETVLLAPLFTCRAAIADLEMPHPSIESSFATRLANARALAIGAENVGWRPLLPPESLRSGILLLKRAGGGPGPSADAIRAYFAACGLTLTAYEGSVIRLAMPTDPFTRRQLERILHALRHGARLHASETVDRRGMTPETPARLAE